MSRYILTYFNIRGKAEGIRLLLEDNGIPYSEIRYSFDEWKNGGLKKNYPFGQLPQLQDLEKKFKIVQTQAIMRELAREHKLYGATEEERRRCDVLQEALVDSRDELVKFFLKKDFSQKRAEFSSKELRERLDPLHKFYKENSGSQTFFCVGNSVSYVDYLLYVYLDYVRAFDLKTLESYDGFMTFKKGMDQRDNIKKYLLSERRPKVSTMPFFQFGNTPETS